MQLISPGLTALVKIMLNRITNFLSLFGSLSTLLCCALPVTLVSLGLGASFATFTAAFPKTIWLMEHKNYLFAITFILLILSWLMLRKSLSTPCPVDLKLRRACQRSKNISKLFLSISLVAYLTAIFFSFILPQFYQGF